MRGVQFRRVVWICEILSQCICKIRDTVRSKRHSSHVLMFHNICIEKSLRNDNYDITLRRLKEIIIWHKRNGYIFKSVDEFSDQTKEKCCFMTFDDGYNSILRAVPVMERYGVPFCIYIITSRIGNNGYLSKEEILELSQNPLCTIGAHTHTHTYTRYLNGEELENELITCKKILENITSLNIVHFAYPYGSYVACSVFDDIAVRKAGYKTIMTTKQVPLLHRYKYMRIPRFDGSRKDLLEVI